MSPRPDKSAAFLQALEVSASPPAAEPSPKPLPPKSALRTQPFPSQVARAGLKHIGGYLDRETQERVVLLKTRLDLDNSALLRLAIETLWFEEKARRAFDSPA